jgi:hypothetical protein
MCWICNISLPKTLAHQSVRQNCPGSFGNKCAPLSAAGWEQCAGPSAVRKRAARGGMVRVGTSPVVAGRFRWRPLKRDLRRFGTDHDVRPPNSERGGATLASRIGCRGTRPTDARPQRRNTVVRSPGSGWAPAGTVDGFLPFRGPSPGTEAGSSPVVPGWVNETGDCIA